MAGPLVPSFLVFVRIGDARLVPLCRPSQKANSLCRKTRIMTNCCSPIGGDPNADRCKMGITAIWSQNDRGDALLVLLGGEEKREGLTCLVPLHCQSAFQLARSMSLKVAGRSSGAMSSSQTVAE
jgi:hypothetical protein